MGVVPNDGIGAKMLPQRRKAKPAVRCQPKIRERQYAVSSRQQKTIGGRQNAAKSKKERDDWKISKFVIANSNWLHPDLRSLVPGPRSPVIRHRSTGKSSVQLAVMSPWTLLAES